MLYDFNGFFVVFDRRGGIECLDKMEVHFLFGLLQVQCDGHQVDGCPAIHKAIVRIINRCKRETLGLGGREGRGEQLQLVVWSD